MDSFEEKIINKINPGEDLTEKELALVVDYFETRRDEGERGRWNMEISSLCEIGQRLFVLNWGQGLTEYQENEYLYQPIEVFKEKTTEIIPEHTVEVIKYKDKNGKVLF